MHVAILGNGIAGITAARHLRKRDDDVKITVISAESKYFFSRTALMYLYMGHMEFKDIKPYEDYFWEKNRIDLVFDRIKRVDFEQQELIGESQSLSYDVLIIATGSVPNTFGWPGLDSKRVRGLYHLQDLEYLESVSDEIDHAVIVGGGLIGIELAEMLRSRGKKVSMLIRDKSFWSSVISKPEGDMLSEHITKHHGVKLLFERNLKEINAGADGAVQSITVKESGEKIPCQFVGITTGVKPNVDFLRKSDKLEIDKGILVDAYLKTNLPNVYAIGDCVQMREAPAGHKTMEQVWYVGRMMGETVAKTIVGNPTIYNPGPWFNSAKFMDIEWQTYGLVPAEIEERQEEIFWKHPNEYQAIRMVWDKENKLFQGINVFGIRMRHERFDTWLREGRSIQHVLEHLNDAYFDPELYKSSLQLFMDAVNKQYDFGVSLKKKSWQRIFKLA